CVYMASSKPTTKTPAELRSLAEQEELNELKEALSLLHCWGIHDPEYLPVLGRLLSHKDPEVLRRTLGIMLNYDRYQVNEFEQLKEHLPVFRELLSTQPLALDLIVALCGPSLDLVPHLQNQLRLFPEEGSDLVFKFGPMAKDLVPDLMQ